MKRPTWLAGQRRRNDSLTELQRAELRADLLEAFDREFVTGAGSGQLEGFGPMMVGTSWADGFEDQIHRAYLDGLRHGEDARDRGATMSTERDEPGFYECEHGRGLGRCPECHPRRVVDRDGDVWEAKSDGFWRCLTAESCDVAGRDLVNVCGPLTNLVGDQK